MLNINTHTIRFIPCMLLVFASMLLSACSDLKEGLREGDKQRSGTVAKGKKNKQITKEEDKEEVKESCQLGFSAKATNQLIFPSPEHLYKGDHHDVSVGEKEVGSLFKAAIQSKINYAQGTGDPSKVFDNFVKIASSRHTQYASGAMYHIGDLCEQCGQLDLAKRWYVLSFQNIWFEQTASASSSLAYKKIETLSNTDINLKRVLLLYPTDITNPVGKIDRLEVLKKSYQESVAEPYLSRKENKAQIARLEGLIIQHLTKDQEDFISQLKSLLELTGNVRLDSEAAYRKLEAQLLQCQHMTFALRELGDLYEKYFPNGGQPDYQEAAKYYEKAREPFAWHCLGNLYLNGHIGKIDSQPDYQTAIKYLELSSSPAALASIGELYYKGQLRQPDYEKARYYFERSGTGLAHFYLAMLHVEGHIGQNDSQPDYDRAKYHAEEALEKGNTDAWRILMYLYANGYISQKKGHIDYELAITCGRKLIESIKDNGRARAESIHNLGHIYLLKFVKSKNPQQKEKAFRLAQQYFEEAGLAESICSIGELYEEYASIHADEQNNQVDSYYQKAFEYYSKSGIWRGRLAMLQLCQLDYVTLKDPQEKQQIVDRITQDLPSLAIPEQYYVQGMVAYYQGKWKDAFIFLQQALALGSQEKGLQELIEAIYQDAFTDMVSGLKQISSGLKDLFIVLEAANKESLRNKKDISEESVITDSTGSFPTNKGQGMESQESKERLGVIASERVITTPPSVAEAIIANKLTKAQKQLLRAHRNKLRILGDFSGFSEKKSDVVLPIEFTCLDDKEQEQFEEFKKINKKVNELLSDIQSNQWRAIGIGKPEVLKGTVRGYKGCLSRRINDKDRLVYTVGGPGKILILSWQGHYE